MRKVQVCTRNKVGSEGAEGGVGWQQKKGTTNSPQNATRASRNLLNNTAVSCASSIRRQDQGRLYCERWFQQLQDQRPTTTRYFCQ